MKWLIPLLVLIPSMLSAEERPPVKAVYINFSPHVIQKTLDLLRATEVNAVVLNIKNDDGSISLGQYHKEVIARFKRVGAYVICRLVVFKHSKFRDRNGVIIIDPAYAVQQKGGGLWQDYSRNNWLDPGAEVIWRHTVLTAQNGIRAGCNEINLDYIRFPSPIDGNVFTAVFPATELLRWSDDARKREMIKKFIAYFADNVKDLPISADVFGYAFANGRETGIGQHMEDFARAGFILAPMAYPTHFACNDRLFKVPDPSFVPYEVYDFTSRAGIKYLHDRGLSPPIRPWLQAFSIRNICFYTKKGCPNKCGEVEVQYRGNRFREQIRAIEGRGINEWFAWNPNGEYPRDLFLGK